MAKFFTGQAGKFVLEGFLKSRQQKQEQQALDKRIASQERQNTLLREVEKMRELRLQKQFEYQQTQDAIEAASRLQPVEAGTQGAISGGILAQQYPGYFDPNQTYGQPQEPDIKAYKEGYVRTGEGGVPEFVPYPNLPQAAEEEDRSMSYQEFQVEKYKTEREEKRQARIDANQLKMDSLIAGAQGARTKISEGDVETEVYQVGDTTLPVKSWKPVATSTVNALLRDYGLTTTKNKILKGAKKTKGFKDASPQKKREFLKTILNNNKTIPSDKKKVLYNWVEVYTR